MNESITKNKKKTPRWLSISSTRNFGKYFSPALIFLILFLFSVTLSIFLFTSTKERRLDESVLRFSFEAEGVGINTRELLLQYSDILYAARGLFNASTFVDRAEWKQFIDAQVIDKRYPAIRAVEFVKRVQGDSLEKYIERVRADTSLDINGYPEFMVNPAGERDEYYVVHYVEPLLGNEAAFGFDLFSNQSRREMIELARDTGNIVLSEPITLVQETEVLDAVLMVLPIYELGEVPATLASRRELIVGLSLVVIQTEKLITNVFNSLNLENAFAIRILDNTIEPMDIIPGLYVGENGVIEKAEISSVYNEVGSIVEVIEIGGRIWEIEFIQEQERQSALSGQESSILVFMTGMIISFLVSFVVLGQSQLRIRSQIQARNLTKDLNKAKERAENSLKVEGEAKLKIEQALKNTEDEKHKAEEKTAEVERLNKSMVGRELRMVELKEKITELEKKLGVVDK